jgi:hypothetical protein
MMVSFTFHIGQNRTPAHFLDGRKRKRVSAPQRQWIGDRRSAEMEMTGEMLRYGFGTHQIGLKKMFVDLND